MQIVPRKSLARLSHLVVVLTLLLAAFSGTRAAHADEVSVTFTPAIVTAQPGDTVNLTALFTNNTATDLFISGATFTFADPAFIASGSSGFFNGAFELNANQPLSVSDVVSLFLDPSLPPNGYAIDATFTGRDLADVDNGTVQDRDLGTGSLVLTVTAPSAVPEPSAVAMAAVFGGGLVGLMRRRRAL